MTEIRVEPGPEFVRVASALRDIDKKLPTKFRADLRKQAKPVINEAKANIRGFPAHGMSGSTGLRRRIARGVGIQVGVGRAGAKMRIVTRMPEDEAALPRGMDTPSGWRHPVFGDTNTWVQQRGSAWFRSTIAEAQPDVLAGAMRVVEEAKQQIARAGGRQASL